MKVNFLPAPVGRNGFNLPKSQNLQSFGTNNISVGQSYRGELPSYEQSFGMAKIVSSNNYPENVIPYAKRMDIDSFFSTANNPNSSIDQEEFNERIKNSNNAEIKYYLKKNSNGKYLNSFLEALKANDANPALINELFVKNDSKGKTLLVNAIIPHTNSGFSKVTFDFDAVSALGNLVDLLQDYPKLQCKLLSDKNKEQDTILVCLKNIMRTNYRNGSDFETQNNFRLKCENLHDKINEIIYGLSTQNELISAEDSKNLLHNNIKGLNDYNRNALAIFCSEDFIVSQDTVND